MDRIDEVEEVFILMFMFINIMLSRKLKKSTRRWWVREANLSRDTDGYFQTCFLKIKECDSEHFFKHTRMAKPEYELLLNLIKMDLTITSLRTPISPECRLALTLTYLSHGVTEQYLAWSFKIGKSTVHNIILETCEVLWNVLSKFYVCKPTENDFQEIANDFELIWDLPHCVGAIDGKHIAITNPPKSGSAFYNYKSHFSIVLSAICDAKYCFTAVDVGAYGSQSDGGVLANSPFGKQLLNKTLPLPKEKQLPNSSMTFPYYFVGDPAFPLRENLMRSYPGKLLPLEKRIFNYRLARARVVIENAFGILVARWRILRTTMNKFPENAEKIVLACVGLHNFILLNAQSKSMYCPVRYTDWEDKHGNLHAGEWRQEVAQTPLRSVRLGSNNATRSAFILRDKLMEYCVKEGRIELQNKIK